jgi:hypothetical protein
VHNKKLPEADISQVFLDAQMQIGSIYGQGCTVEKLTGCSSS